jgi:hypothetical protein
MNRIRLSSFFFRFLGHVPLFENDGVRRELEPFGPLAIVIDPAMTKDDDAVVENDAGEELLRVGAPKPAIMGAAAVGDGSEPGPMMS